MGSEELTSVAIIGGGPVGMSLALALHRQGIAAEIFEARERGAGLTDRRILAISHGSRQTLEWLGAWDGIDATPIHTIHVSHRGRLGRTIIRAEDERVPALGYVASLHEIVKALDRAVSANNIVYRDNTRIGDTAADPLCATFGAGGERHRARLVAHAEGAIVESEIAAADVAHRHYGQHALTAIVTTDAVPPHTAWERFTKTGPVALLPFGQALALVQTCCAEEAEVLTSMSATQFLKQLQDRFGPRVRFVGVGPRLAFPLGLRYRKNVVAVRQVWLGNAAQTLHPVAGQGFNLGLRDVRELARTIAGAADPGSTSVLHCYARRRAVDRRSTIGFTDSVVRLFSNNHPLLGHARGAALLALDLFPQARSFVAHRMMFGARAW